MFLGYVSQYKGYICFDVLKHKVYISRHVVFNELEFPYSSLLTQSAQFSNPSISRVSHSPPLVPTLNNILVSPSLPPVSSQLSQPVSSSSILHTTQLVFNPSSSHSPAPIDVPESITGTAT